MFHSKDHLRYFSVHLTHYVKHANVYLQQAIPTVSVQAILTDIFEIG